MINALGWTRTMTDIFLVVPVFAATGEGPMFFPHLSLVLIHFVGLHSTLNAQIETQNQGRTQSSQTQKLWDSRKIVFVSKAPNFISSCLKACHNYFLIRHNMRKLDGIGHQYWSGLDREEF